MPDESSPHSPSPVPSDARLWTGERPFTEFGQWGHGRLDLRVFEQDTWWVNVDGLAFRLESEMSQEYLRNVIAHLEANVEQFYADSLRRATIQAVGDRLLGHPEAAQEAADAMAMTRLAPAEWLEGTLLMRRLRQLVSHPEAGDAPA